MSKSAYYRKPIQATVTEKEIEKAVIHCFNRHRGRCGRVRIRKELLMQDLSVSESKIARILAENGLKAQRGRIGKAKRPKPTEQQYIEEDLIKVPEIEVDLTGKNFGMPSDRQFVSPPVDSDILFNNIVNSSSGVDVQETVGAATGLPTSGNDRLTRISLTTNNKPELHSGGESRSSKEALAGGLPLYFVDGEYYRMTEATIDSIDLSAISDYNALNLVVDNFDVKTGELISSYKLQKDGEKFYLVLQ